MIKNLFLPTILTLILLAGFDNTVRAENVSATNTAATTSTTTGASPEPALKLPLSTPATLTALAQTRLTNLCANLSNRLESIVGRLQNVIDRLDSRLTKMSEAGNDITLAKENLTEAQKKLDLAKTNLKNIDSAVASFVGSNNPGESWQDLKFTFLNARDAIIASHTLIMQTIEKAQTAKNLPVSANLSASSTTATTSSSTSNQ